MKTIEERSLPEARTIALLSGLAIGLGLVVHQVFFWVAFGIWAFAVTEWTLGKRHEQSGDRRLIHRHP
jgi:hypothetical protein